MFKLGIDLGGTKIEGIALAEDGSEVFRKRIPTEQEKGYDAVLANLAGLYSELVRAVGGGAHTLGMGVPGITSLKTGLIKNSNTLCLLGQPLHSDFEKRIGHPVALQNDANCFAEAEALLGAGKDHDLVFGVIMGTGCGGGIVYRGKVIVGRMAIAGEWGHMSIDPRGPLCYCGRRGCVETFISGGGLQKRWQERYGTRKDLREIVAAYRAGNGEAGAFMQEFFRHFGHAMANLIDILDPDVVVLGGGVSNIAELYTEGVRQVEHCVFSDGLETPILKHRLGDSAGVIGAALIGI